MNKAHWRYTASMIKDQVELKKHRCVVDDGVVFELILTGELKGMTSPVSGTYRTAAEAVKRLRKTLIGRRSILIAKRGVLDRQIPACDKYLEYEGED